MVAKNLVVQLVLILFQRILAPIYALRPKFKNSIKPNILSEIFGRKPTVTDHLPKFALAVGFISISAIIGILAMLIFSPVQ